MQIPYTASMKKTIDYRLPVPQTTRTWKKIFSGCFLHVYFPFPKFFRLKQTAPT